MAKFKFIVESTKTGYSAYEENEPVFTTGDSILDLQQNSLEAINLHLEELSKSPVTQEALDFELDFQQFFEYYKVINAKYLADRIGMNESLLSQYVNGVKKPSKRQIERLVNGLNEIGKELMDLSLV